MLFSTFFFSHSLRRSARNRGRISHGRHPKWSTTNHLRHIVYDLCTALWLFGRSIFPSLDHDVGRSVMEWHNIVGLIYGHLSHIYTIPSSGRHRWSIIQYNSANNHLRFVHQWSTIQDVGHVLFCYTSWFWVWVSSNLCYNYMDMHPWNVLNVVGSLWAINPNLLLFWMQQVYCWCKNSVRVR